MRDLRARLALMAVALTIEGKIFMSTIAPSKSGPKNGTFTHKNRQGWTEKHAEVLSVLLFYFHK